MPAAVGVFGCYVSMEPMKLSDEVLGFQAKSRVYLSQSKTYAPLTVQGHFEGRNLSARTSPLKHGEFLTLSILVQEWRQNCLFGEVLDYTLASRLNRPSTTVMHTPKKRSYKTMAAGKLTRLSIIS